jgi:hypothetical protein
MAERMYSLFRRQDGKWVRVSSNAYPKKTAVRLFQNQLLDSAFTPSPLELRAVPAEKPSPIPASEVLCEACEKHIHGACTGGSCQCACGFVSGARA